MGLFFSTKPSKDKGKLVIPMIKKNNWRVESENESIKIEDKEAVNELLKGTLHASILFKVVDVQMLINTKKNIVFRFVE